MLIEIHTIQNHSFANLNRDDLGAPKTCYFGGVMRSRISSQCLKRSIRKSEEFKQLCGGIRTRRLPKLLASQVKDRDVLPIATAVVQRCGILHDKQQSDKKDVIVFLSQSAARHMVKLLQQTRDNPPENTLKQLATQFAQLITNERYVPDMALSGRMLEPAKSRDAKKKGKSTETDESEPQADKEKADGIWEDLDPSIEAALQVAHAISTHEARLEVDYFVAADDVKGEDAGGAHIGEALFSSACFYKYFSIHWEMLVSNLQGFNGNTEHLAAHTVGAFILASACANPTGKQNSCAAHNRPDGMLIEIKDAPVSYANAFAKPVQHGQRDIIDQSIAQLAQYVRDLDVGYGKPAHRIWFSPNLRYPLLVVENGEEIQLSNNNEPSIKGAVQNLISYMGYTWDEVRNVTLGRESLL